jgi:hypothetical protein
MSKLIYILRNFKNISNLKICSDFHYFHRAQNCFDLRHNYTNIKTLEIDAPFNHQHFFMLMTCLPNVHTLKLDTLTNIDLHDEILPLSYDWDDTSFPNVKNLEIKYSHANERDFSTRFSFPSEYAYSIHRLLKATPNLSELTIDGGFLRTNREGIIDHMPTMTKVEELTILNEDFYVDSTKALLTHFPAAKRVNISTISDISTYDLYEVLPSSAILSVTNISEDPAGVTESLEIVEARAFRDFLDSRYDHHQTDDYSHWSSGLMLQCMDEPHLKHLNPYLLDEGDLKTLQVPDFLS